MEKEQQVLRVRMFGKERITYADKQIMSGRNSLTKAVKLFLILVHSGRSGIARSRLLGDLFGRDELADASNNLRVTLYRLKKLLVEVGLPEYEYIVVSGGVYYWESPMETEVDALVFKDLIARSEEEPDQEKSIGMLKEACEMYSGDFLEKMSGDEWVLLESVYYKNLYTDALNRVCDYLMEQKEYRDVLRLVGTACEIYPFDEWQAVKIGCLIAMNRYKDAMKEYEDTAKMLLEELGISPSEKMMKQFDMMSKRISNRPQIIGEIKKSLQEETEEQGAFYCSLPSFRDAYRVIHRGMERNGQSTFLMVCALIDSRGRPMEAVEKLEEMSECLFHAIKDSLRRCDSFTKYSQSQFLVLLMGTNKENCQIVIDRVSKCFAKDHKSWTQHLECSVSSLYDISYDEKRPRFGASNLINICVDERFDGELSGRLYHCYTKDAIGFGNVIELVKKMEQLFDDISFPQASTRTRSFGEAEEYRGRQHGERETEREDVIQHKGILGTFVTQVKLRQNSTWQGEMLWMEKGTRKNFSNMLDLIKLIDNALIGSEENRKEG